MATRQHILPRFLLKGFASRIDGKEVYTWVYRSNGNIYETNIINVSVEKYFYGREGEPNVDNEITDLEGEYALLLDRLRARQEREEICNVGIADFIAHLAVRTKHLRDSLHESSEFLVDRILEYLADFENVKALILNNPELMRDELEKTLKDLPLSRARKDLLGLAVRHILPDLIDAQKEKIQSLSQYFCAIVKSSFPGSIKQGHIKALSKGLIPEPRAERYRELRWFVSNTEDPLILGDAGCLFETAGKKRFKSISEKDDQIKNVFLPLSYHQILVGTSLGMCPQIDVKLINAGTAKLSREFFVCSRSSPEFGLLLAQIGREAEIISKADLAGIVAKSLLEFKRS